jgi:DNA-binding MarR family transcriptional regulator
VTLIALVLLLNLGGLSLECGIQKELRNGFGVQNEKRSVWSAAMTERQMEVLHFIEDFIKYRGFSPSYADIATGLKLKSKSNIHRIIHDLKDRGLLKVQPNKIRSLVPIDKTVEKMTSL